MMMIHPAAARTLPPTTRFSGKRPEPGLHTYDSTQEYFAKQNWHGFSPRGALSASQILDKAPTPQPGADRILLLGREPHNDQRFGPIVQQATNNGASLVVIRDAISRLGNILPLPTPNMVSRLQGYLRQNAEGKLFYGDGVTDTLLLGHSQPSRNGAKICREGTQQWLPIHGEIEVAKGDRLALPSFYKGSDTLVTV